MLAFLSQFAAFSDFFRTRFATSARDRDKLPLSLKATLNGDDAMTAEDIVGYWASTMVFLTFVTKDMRLLRVLALISNVAFLSYGLLAWLPPVFCLHLVLMPINAIRLGQILQAKGYHASVHWLATRVPQFYPAHQGPGRLVA
jgi:hypothetical protein